MTATTTPHILPVSDAVKAKAAQIKLLALDVDGVLTNGKLYFGEGGEALKRFSILDGLGIKLLQKFGIQTVIITARSSGIVRARARELGIEHVMQGREDKLQALQELQHTLGISLQQTAYVGDDLPDLSAIQACGPGITVANAYHAVKASADWVCHANGGDGAVREVADILLAASGHLDEAIELYTS